MANGVGAGIYAAKLDIRRRFKLPKYCSIFQAEGFAFRKVAEMANNARNDIKNTIIR